MHIQTECLNCGFGFFMTHGNKKYCSDNCRTIYLESLYKKPSETDLEHGTDGYHNAKAYHKGIIEKKDIQLLKRLVYSAKIRAKKYNIPFNITYHDLEFPQHCPLIGVELKRKRVGFMYRGQAPSIDKIIPELGYVKGNVWIISFRANQIKSNLSQQELVYFSKGLLKKFGELQTIKNPNITDGIL